MTSHQLRTVRLMPFADTVPILETYTSIPALRNALIVYRLEIANTDAISKLLSPMLNAKVRHPDSSALLACRTDWWPRSFCKTRRITVSLWRS